MIKTILSFGAVILLLGCAPSSSVEPRFSAKASTEARIDRLEDSEVSEASIASSESRTYFLIPTKLLLDSEYDELRNNLENFSLSEKQLRLRSFEEAVGLIGDLLDKKYGNTLQAEVLPSSRMVIITTTQNLDLSILRDLIENVDE